jgi:hypothetical protein
MKIRQPVRLIISLIMLISILSACGSGSGDAAQQSTLEAISAYVRETATAKAALDQNPNAAIETAHAQATSQEQSAAATKAAQGELSSEAQAATASAVAPILAELPKYDVDPSAGRMGWIHPPESLEVEGFMQYDYVNYFISVIAQDFVISADITWDAIGSEASCGFVLRSDGNEAAMDTYLATISRVASGHFLFLTVAKGEVVTGQDIYAYGRDPAFNWQNSATNRLTVVGRDNHFWIYTNGTLIGDVDPSAPPQLVLPPEPEKPADAANAEAMAQFALDQANFEAESNLVRAEYRARLQALKDADTVFERGFMALVALSRAGKKATCQFDNAWLWLIE